MSEIQELQAALNSVNKFYSLVRILVLRVSDKTRTGKYSKGQLCDIGFLCRELVSQCEEIRKDVGAVKVLVDKIACVKVMHQTLSDPTISQTIQGELASGTPHYKKSVTLPKKDTKEFYDLYKYFGINPHGVELGVAKISWKKVCKYVTELAEMGKPIPDFIPKVHDDYTVIHRRK